MPGRPAAGVLNPDSPERRDFPCRIADVRLKSGDIIRMETGGGGGVGDPKERPANGVRDDIEDGYITERGAVEFYGAKP